MPEPMRRHPTNGANVIVKMKEAPQLYVVSRKHLTALMNFLNRNAKPVGEETVPADEVFKDLYAKYTKPGVAVRGGRTKEGLTQVELAKRLGIAQGDVSAMENGKKSIGKKMAKRLSKVLRIHYRVFL